MIDHTIGTAEMIDVRPSVWIVHGVGQVFDQDGLEPMLLELSQTEGSSEDTHIRMHTAEGDLLDPLGFQDIPNLLP
jgi:hypothetical protein